MSEDHSYRQRQTDYAQFHQSETQTGSYWLPAKVPLTCLTPALQSFTTLIFADMSSDRTEGYLCTSACKTFLAHYPATLEMLLHYPEKNARCGISPNMLSWEFTIPKPTEQPGFSGNLYRKTGWEVEKLHNLIKKQHKQSCCNRILSGLSQVSCKSQ